MRASVIAVLVAALVAHATAQCPRYKTLVFTDTSNDARGLEDTFRDFQRTLGGRDNESNRGPIRDGFRRINWDADVVPFDMPGDFFDRVVTRGAVFRTRSGEFRVSNPPKLQQPPKDDRFDSILPRALTSQFVRFSKERLFTPLNSNRMTMTYRVPDTNIKAAVTGFGAVFTDVDRRRATFLEFFDRKGCLIAKVDVPPRNKGLSFAGLVVLDPKSSRRLIPVVWRVRFKLGNISVWDFARRYRGRLFADVVVMDDFLFGEPQGRRRGGGGKGGKGRPGPGDPGYNIG